MAEKRVSLRHVLIVGAAVLWLAVSAVSVPLSSYGVGRALGALAIAALVRAIYRVVAKRWRPDRPFLAPSLFILAAAFAILATIGKQSERVAEARANAVNQGVVTDGDLASKIDLCVAGNLSQFDATPPAERLGFTRRQFRRFYEQVCAEADRQGFLLRDGTMSMRDASKLQDEAGAILRRMRTNGEL